MKKIQIIATYVLITLVFCVLGASRTSWQIQIPPAIPEYDQWVERLIDQWLDQVQQSAGPTDAGGGIDPELLTEEAFCNGWRSRKKKRRKRILDLPGGRSPAVRS